MDGAARSIGWTGSTADSSDVVVLVELRAITRVATVPQYASASTASPISAPGSDPRETFSPCRPVFMGVS